MFKIERLSIDVKNEDLKFNELEAYDDLRTLCYEHKSEMELSGIKLEIVKMVKKERCDKCDSLGKVYRVIKENRINKRREY